MNGLLIGLVCAGGFVGAPTRFLVDRFVTSRTTGDLPWGTFVVNVSGAFIFGLLSGLFVVGHVDEKVTTLLGTGFCGALTTFSTWSFETIRLSQKGEYVNAFLNSTVSLIIGLLVAAGGIALGLAV